MRPVMQKQPHYENRRLLDLCQGAPCFLNFPGCTGGEDTERPSVPCHDNRQKNGRGFAYKSHDHAAVPGCPSCHHALDYGPYTREQKDEAIQNAQERWRDYLWRNKLIRVA